MKYEIFEITYKDNECRLMQGNYYWETHEGKRAEYDTRFSDKQDAIDTIYHMQTIGYYSANFTILEIY